MRAQRRRHLLERLKQGGEDTLISAHERILRIGNIEDRSAVVGIDYHLHRVADIVDAARLVPLRVRQHITHRIRILYPDQSSVTNGQIRITIELKERGDAPDAVLDEATKQHPKYQANNARRQILPKDTPSRPW